MSYRRRVNPLHNIRPPKDVTRFWQAPHCGPGTLDGTEICGFCGRSLIECADVNTESVATTGAQDCGGAGLWCKQCGRFWAQDSCGECNPPYLRASDGAEMAVKGEWSYCVCGNRLAQIDSH